MKRERLDRALAACGAVLKRSKKHMIYALPNGKSLTVAATPGDSRAEDNALNDLRHALGTQPRVAVVNPPREKRKKPGRADAPWSPAISPLAEALKQSGVHSDAELTKARETERELRWHVHALETDLATAQARVAELEGLAVVRAWRFSARTLGLLRTTRRSCRSNSVTVRSAHDS